MPSQRLKMFFESVPILQIGLIYNLLNRKDLEAVNKVGHKA